MGRRPVVPCLQPRGLSLESPAPGCFLCRCAVFPSGWCCWWLVSLVAGVAVALCRRWCEVPGVPGWHVERREGVGATVVVLPVWVGPLIVPFRVPVPGTPAVVVLPGPWVVVVVVDVPPVFVLPVGGPVVSRVSRSSAPVGVAVLRVLGARVVLLPGSDALVPDVCPRVPLLACSVAAVPRVPLLACSVAAVPRVPQLACSVAAVPRVPLLACSVATVPRVEPPTAGTTSRGVGEATAVDGVVLERSGHHQSVAFEVRT